MRIKNVKGRGAYIRTNINVFIYTFMYKSVATDVHAYNLTCLHTHKQTCPHTFIHIRVQKKHSRTYRETRTVTTQSDMFINTSTHPHTHPYVFFYFSYSVFYFVHHFSCFILQTPYASYAPSHLPHKFVHFALLRRFIPSSTRDLDVSYFHPLPFLCIIIASAVRQIED